MLRETLLLPSTKPIDLKRVMKSKRFFRFVFIESKFLTLCFVSFVVEHIQRMYEENKGKIGRFNGATERRVMRRAEGSACFCDDNGRFTNGSNRDSLMRSGERVLGSFVLAEKGRTVAARLLQATQPS